MQKFKLKAEKRDIVGKKARKLRQEGVLPVGIYGKDVKSESLSVPMKEFGVIYAKAGETGLVELEVGGKVHNVLISNVQIHPLSRKMLHAELHAVKLTEKIKAKVPVELEGEAPVVKGGTGVILQTLNEVEVEALPAELPEAIVVNVEGFGEIGLQVKVSDLKIPKGVELLTDGEEIVVSVGAAVSEETVKEMAAEEAAKAEAETGAGEEAVSPAAEEAPKDEKAEVEK